MQPLRYEMTLTCCCFSFLASKCHFTFSMLDLPLPRLEKFSGENQFEQIITYVFTFPSTFQAVLSGLDSKDWLLVCDTLNNVRRLALFHREVMLDMV